MSSSSNAASSAGSSSLRPAWHKGNQGGRGFQPPPSVDSRTRSTSLGSDPKRDVNKFSALEDDDNEFVPVTVRSNSVSKNTEDTANKQQPPAPNSRSEAFRSSFRPPGGGRTLADLAARVPEAPGLPRSHSTGYAAATTNNSGRFSGLRSSDPNAAAAAAAAGGGSIAEKAEAKIIRYTREKLLSMRPPPKPDAEPPAELKGIEGSVILSKAPLDPVCWDTLDADEIWSVSRDRRVATTGAAVKTAPGLVRTNSEGPENRRSRPPVAVSGGRWERGVALPPPDENKGRRDRDADHPDDLWDDPVGGAVGAASDFSAFGAIPDDPREPNNDVFDFEKMAEMSKKFEDELHGSRKSSDADLADDEEVDEENMHLVKVDPKRPLASAGTTIRSGSGDHVNVFEDFDDPGSEPDEPVAPIKGGEENPSSSSRLMKMIGVNKDESDSGLAAAAAAAATDFPATEGRELSTDGAEQPKEFPTAADHEQRGEESVEQHIKPALSSIPSNPWGGPLISSGPEVNQHQTIGLDLAARLEALAAEQKARDLEFERKAELLRLRQEQEEAQRRALAQKQAEEQARQQAQAAALQQQQQQQASGHTQVELVLMERICRILENSWGRSDLISILSTLHSEDSRVIPLLGTADALRALIARHPQRVALRHDPAFGAEMAVLGMTNAQWQQQQLQQQQAQARAQQEELQRREQQRRLLALQQQQQQEAAARAQSELMKRSIPAVIPNAPWYYTDPQNSIQGPFRGDEMRQWLEAGYFKGDLPISQQPSGPFHQLSLYFPDMTAAFTVPQTSNPAAEDETRARAQAEEEERRRRQIQLQREEEERHRRAAEAATAARAEAEAAAEAERERFAAERMAAERMVAETNRKLAEGSNGSSRQEAQAQNESSHQLKMLLGLGSSSSLSIDAGDQPLLNEHAESCSSREPVQQQEKPSQKAARVQQRVAPLEPEVAEAQLPAKPVAPAWGGAATSKAIPRKSMSEIQQEEARAAERLAMQRGNQPGPNQRSGWANVAASGTSAAWSGAAKPTATAVVGVNTVAAAGVARLATANPGLAPTAARPRQAGPNPAATRPTGAVPVQQRSNDPANVDEFGASMNPTLERWCKDQMIKLNGSDDLTLVSFCMTLNDPVEIRQYLTTYLGSTPQVNNFATEFINKKAGKGTQDDWETPAAAKKGKKKTKGGR